jgi:hypothetical protein
MNVHSSSVYFIKAPNKIQPRYPSTDEWMSKFWYFYTMECYSKNMHIPTND